MYIVRSLSRFIWSGAIIVESADRSAVDTGASSQLITTIILGLKHIELSSGLCLEPVAHLILVERILGIYYSIGGVGLFGHSLAIGLLVVWGCWVSF